jgi:hypothetical protein
MSSERLPLPLPAVDQTNMLKVRRFLEKNIPALGKRCFPYDRTVR